MQLRIDGKLYKVEIIKKKTNRNTYIRVKDDLTIYVTTNYFVREKQIVKLLEDSIPSIRKMIEVKTRKKDIDSNFYYLGKKYDVIYTNANDLVLGNDKVFIPKNFDLDKWYKKKASTLFLERLNYNYHNYSLNIPYPSLTIRKMTSRWGVCNTKLKRVTLNLELIKRDIICLDYVIIHELSHFIEPNHSKKFWTLVEENCPDYKNNERVLNL